MDKRFKTRITIDIHDWEVVVMAEAGYDYQDGRFFDWGRFNEEHGFTYEEMGYDLISNASWPVCDESKLVEDTREIAVQVNGKVRATISISVDEAEESIKNKALECENVKRHLEGLEIIKIMVIKNR